MQTAIEQIAENERMFVSFLQNFREDYFSRKLKDLPPHVQEETQAFYHALHAKIIAQFVSELKDKDRKIAELEARNRELEGLRIRDHNYAAQTQTTNNSLQDQIAKLKKTNWEDALIAHVQEENWKDAPISRVEVC